MKIDIRKVLKNLTKIIKLLLLDPDIRTKFIDIFLLRM